MKSAGIIKMLIAGDGGQGVQTIAAILAQALFKDGHQVSLVPNYGLEQRGGMSLAYLQVSNSPIVYPRFSKPDILAIMSEEAKERVKQYMFEDIRILDIKDIKDIGEIKKGSLNMFFLGLLTKILVEKDILKKEAVKEEIKIKLAEKNWLEENLRAFEFGLIHNS